MRQKYSGGTWTGSSGDPFPAVTSDEQSHGEVLFPGESVLFEMRVPEDSLPYLDIRVEGSVSQRHLLHLSRPIEDLRQWTQPRVVEVFEALERIDLYGPLVSLTEATPVFGPQTTLADLDAFRSEVEKAIAHEKRVMPELNKVFRSAPNQALRDLMKQHIGEFLTTCQRLCSAVIETLSGSDTERMQKAAGDLKAHLSTLGEVKRQQAELKSCFGIEAD